MRGGPGGYHSNHETESSSHPSGSAAGIAAVNGGDGDRSSKHDSIPKEQREGRPPRDPRPRGNNNNSSTVSVSGSGANSQQAKQSSSDSDSKLVKNKMNSNSKTKDHIVNGDK